MTTVNTNTVSSIADTLVSLKNKNVTNKASDSQQFMTVLLAQLKNQNFSNPTDTGELMQQMSITNNMKAMEEMTSLLQESNQLSQMSAFAALIGKSVSYTDSNTGNTQSGTVDSISLNNGNYMLKLTNGREVDINSVTGLGAKQI